MRVETDRSRNGYREYSERKSNDRLKRRNYRNDNHPYHSSRISLESRHHHNKNSSSNRIGDYTDHSLTSRFDRPTNTHEIYSEVLTNQPPTDSYYNSSRDRSSYTERNRYPPSSSSTYRRESSPPSSTSYRNDVYRSPTSLSIRSPYTDIYRSSDYQSHSERYDISQDRNCLPSPVYRSDSYQTPSSSYVTHDQYLSTRDYEIPPTMDHHYRSTSSYRDRSRSNFNRR